MSLDDVFFYLFALLTLGGAVLTVALRNAVHCAISLIVSLAGVAGLYLLQKAEFLFAVQIVLYIGGIMVLFLFVIMLVNLDSASQERQYHRRWVVALPCAVAVGGLVVAFLVKGGGAFQVVRQPAVSASGAGGNIEQLADVLFSEYLLPFEVASLLLLVAIVGSVIMAKKKDA
jgi:NADH-quinone oxidoreductase subunit J